MPQLFGTSFEGALAPPGVQLRRVDDVDALRRSIYDKSIEAVSNIPEIQSGQYVLRLRNPHYSDPEDYPIERQKQAILNGRSLSRRIRGTWELVDSKTGKVIDRATRTVVNVPYLTPRGVFIIRGSEYALSNQLRLKPGVYNRVKENGEVESHINVLPGQGLQHRIHWDPSTGVYRLNVAGSNVPLFSVLRIFGVKPETIQKYWPGEVYKANAKYGRSDVTAKLYRKLVRDPNPKASPEEMRQAVVNFFQSMKLDPEVNRTTLGRPLDTSGPEVWLEASRRLRAIYRGDERPDDRDQPNFQKFVGIDDLIAERLRNAVSAIRPHLWKSVRKRSLESLLPAVLDKNIKELIYDSGLGAALEETNSLEILDQLTRITRMGQGGLGSVESIPMEARMVHPSSYGFWDYVRTPESLKIGVDLRLTNSAHVGSDGEIYVPAYNHRTGKMEFVSPAKLKGKVMAFPLEMGRGKKYVRALVDGSFQYVKPSEVDYSIPHAEAAFNHLSNLVPFKSNTHNQRIAMGSRMLMQALPLAKPESPLVQSDAPYIDASSFEKQYSPYLSAIYASSLGAIRTSQGGKVLKVDDKKIVVRHDDGTKKEYELYVDYPNNRKTYLYNIPTVKAGDRVEAGQLLARSNQTDETGEVALGKNLRVAYLADGWTVEDGITISESASKKFTSEHLYQHDYDWDNKSRKGKKAYVSLFPTAWNRQVLDRMDDDGVIRKGEVVQQGEPLILAAKELERSHNQLARSKSSWRDDTVTWEHSTPGMVTDVVKGPSGVKVLVKTYAPSQVGDKLSGLWGDKSVIARIVPDEEMPVDEQGRPVEVLINPTGLTRRNPSQIIAAALGKVAEKTGKPYRISDFESIDNAIQFAKRELEKAGLKPYEDLTDPRTGRKIRRVFTGNRYLLKLHHMAEDKESGRSLGGYTSEGLPSRGGDQSAKRMGLSDIYALLSLGATNVIKDKTIRGNRNLDYWALYMSGKTPPRPKTSAVYDKFLNYLRAAGIDPVPEGDDLRLMPLTKSTIDKMVGNRKLENAELVDWKKGMRPVKGGLFDERLTGGHGSSGRWSYIELPEPYPAPAFEEPIRYLLGLSKDQYDSILRGKSSLGGKSGPRAILSALESIDVDKALARSKVQARMAKRSDRDAAVKRVTFLTAAKRYGVHPKEWMTDKIPVLPPAFRPVSVLGKSKSPLVSDANVLYQELFDAVQAYRDLDRKVEDLSEERGAIYNAIKAVYGLGEPITRESKERGVRGLLKTVFGKSPKHSIMQSRILSGSVDLVGRGVITLGSDQDMDTIGVPEKLAWRLYHPFVVRRLVRMGMPPYLAVKEVEGRTDRAKKHLLDEMAHRPVIASRAPVLHRYGFLAFYPKLTSGSTIRVPSPVLKGYGADFDGNCISGDSRVRIRVDWIQAYSSVYDRDLIRKLDAWRNVLCSGEELRQTGEYVVRIDNVFRLPYPVQDKNGAWIHDAIGGLEVLSYDLDEGKVAYLPVTSITVEYDSPCSWVETSSGRRVRASDNPSLAAWSADNGKLVKVSPKDCVGKWFPVVAVTPEDLERDPDEDWIPVDAKVVSLLAGSIAHQDSGLYNILCAGLHAGAIRRKHAIAAIRVGSRHYSKVSHDRQRRWARIAECREVFWDHYTRIQDGGRRTVYDLVVPGTKVFTLEDGMVIYDTMSLHVPVSDEAVEDAKELMLPSRNILSVKDFKVHQLPVNELLGGLYVASSRKSNRRKAQTFRSIRDLIAAYRNGEIEIGDPVEVISDAD